MAPASGYRCKSIVPLHRSRDTPIRMAYKTKRALKLMTTLLSLEHLIMGYGSDGSWARTRIPNIVIFLPRHKVAEPCEPRNIPHRSSL
jgi:hypothetical protein